MIIVKKERRRWCWATEASYVCVSARKARQRQRVRELEQESCM